MKYYKSESGDVFAFEADGSQDAYINPGLVRMTDAEVEAHLNPPAPPPSSADVDSERDRRIDAGVEFNGVIYQSSSGDRENISGSAQLAFMAIVGGAQPGDLRWSDPNEDFEWIALDNSRVPMDAQTVVEFGKVAATRKQAMIFAGSDLKAMQPIPADYKDDKWWPNEPVPATPSS